MIRRPAMHPITLPHQTLLLQWLQAPSQFVETGAPLLQVQIDGKARTITAPSRGFLLQLRAPGSLTDPGEPLGMLSETPAPLPPPPGWLLKTVYLPPLTESTTEVWVSGWQQRVGGRLVEGEPLVEVDTDKVCVELPVEEDGVLLSILAEEGEEVAIGAPIATVLVAADGPRVLPVALQVQWRAIQALMAPGEDGAVRLTDAERQVLARQLSAFLARLLAS